MIPILILAGGSSRRMMGRDKLLETVAGKPLLRRLAMRALDTGCDVFVALPPDSADRVTVLDGLAVTPLLIDAAGDGMGATLRDSVAQLPPCPAFMVVLGDMPDITTSDMGAIIAARDDNPDNLIWRASTLDGAHGHPVIFDASLRGAFATLSGDRGAASIVAPLGEKTHLEPLADDRARCDLDMPADWAAWRARTSK